jgi:hypothetical protein
MFGDDPSRVPSLLEEHARALLPSDGLAHAQTTLTGQSLLEDGLVATSRAVVACTITPGFVHMIICARSCLIRPTREVPCCKPVTF